MGETKPAIPTEDELRTDYIVKRLKFEDIRNKYGLSKKKLANLIHQYGFSRPPLKHFDTFKGGIKEKIKTGEYPSKDLVYDLFVAQNRTRSDCASYFNMTENQFRRLLKFYGVTKSESAQIENMKSACLYKYGYTNAMQNADIAAHSKQRCAELRGAGLLNTKDKRLKKAEARKQKESQLPSKSDIVDYYIAQCHTIAETCEHFGIGKGVFYRLKTQYCVVKPKSSTAKAFNREADKRAEEWRQKLLAYMGTLSTKPTINELAANFGYSYTGMSNILNLAELRDPEHIDYYRTYSQEERDVSDYIRSLGVAIQNNVNILDGREIDIYAPDYHVGVEFNGDYWHTDKFVERDYHFNKVRLAEEKGIHLIHIYEYEWRDERKQNILKSLLRLVFGKIQNRIYARKCEVRKITNAEARSFNDENHLQGHRNAQVTYGLFYNGELVQLMSFSRTRYNKNLTSSDDWEIIRGCPGSVNLVVGGVSKLFSHFVREYNPKTVFSYCDYNKFSGKSYEAIGMEFVGFTGPDHKWVINGQVINRNPSKHEEYKAKAENSLWGAGSKKFLWRNPDYHRGG